MIHLKNPTKFDLTLNFSQNSYKEFIENLKSIALNCNQLKHLHSSAKPIHHLINKYSIAGNISKIEIFWN
jgi:hypothetical protein